VPEWSAEVWGIVSTGVVGGLGLVISFVALGVAYKALKVQERGVEVTVSSEQRSRSAELFTHSPILLAKRGKARFYLHNHGSSDAYDVDLTLHHGDACLCFGEHDRITAGGMWPFEQSAEQFIGQLNRASEAELELRATYRDGTGARTETWRVSIPPGEQFDKRTWTVEKLPEYDQPRGAIGQNRDRFR
jgi:hypothetical protein